MTSVQTVCFQGLNTTPVDVQVQLASGLPAFILVGLPDKAVAESKERVRAALYALGIAFPAKRITINLAPSDLQKEGSHYDLPIALALLRALGALPSDALQGFVALGELALDSRLMKATGILSAALFASSQKKGLICAFESGPEAAWAGEIPLIAARSLIEIINHFKGTQTLKAPEPLKETKLLHQKNIEDVKGQALAKRALLIAAAGRHNLLMCGPPGVGKSMLAERLPSLLPPLSPAEALTATMIYSVAGLLKEGRLLTRRPFRNPHHSASMAALVGGGLRGKPGEISLAHGGILFLDELPEFQRNLLEALRQPLESKEAVISRVNTHVSYPANAQLIAAMNPCACGYLGDPVKQCKKAPGCGARYASRLSGPLLDRIDMHLQMEGLSPLGLQQVEQGKTSKELKTQVIKAYEAQRMRFPVAEKEDPLKEAPFLNGEVDFALLEPHLFLSREALCTVNNAVKRLHLSTRSYHKVLRLARTIADLAHSHRIEKIHMLEALTYRPPHALHKAA